MAEPNEAKLELFPCPCCGYLVFGCPPGGYGICPICFWEDDPVQLRYLNDSGGANKPSLIEAQRNYQQFGACEQHCLRFVRKPTGQDKQDASWRPVDESIDSIEELNREVGTPWPEDLTELYYWRHNHKK